MCEMFSGPDDTLVACVSTSGVDCCQFHEQTVEGEESTVQVGRKRVPC